MFYLKYIKRIFDLIIATLVVIAIFPLIVIVYILVFIAMGKPVIFCQKRIGLDEQNFIIYKFRTMSVDGQHITRLGSFLRKTSLDELPQLFNVLQGSMSLVGPRPYLVKYLPLYSDEERIRHSIRPGITGLAQIWGRNTLSWDDKLQLDIDYTKNCNFCLDMYILFMTIPKLFANPNIISSDLSEERKDKTTNNE